MRNKALHSPAAAALLCRLFRMGRPLKAVSKACLNSIVLDVRLRLRDSRGDAFQGLDCDTSCNAGAPNLASHVLAASYSRCQLASCSCIPVNLLSCDPAFGAYMLCLLCKGSPMHCLSN